MHKDAAGLEVLSREESLVLLSSVPVGRIVFTDRALPAILPVNFVLDDSTIVFRTGAGSKLAAATREAIVAFEADSFHEATGTGWSVTVVGSAHSVEDPDEIARLATLPLRPWVPVTPEHYVRIDIAQVTGRRIPPRDAP
ncbi:MAG: pyridoxamine 5'-phosphate oxidase family protein [Jiangellaceae bacterium]